MLDVDEGSDSAALLGLRHDGQGEGGLARGLGAVDLDDTTLRESADPKGAVDEQVAGRDRSNVNGSGLPETHDGAIAVVLGDRLDGEVEVLGAGCGCLLGGCVFFGHGRGIVCVGTG